MKQKNYFPQALILGLIVVVVVILANIYSSNFAPPSPPPTISILRADGNPQFGLATPTIVPVGEFPSVDKNMLPGNFDGAGNRLPSVEVKADEDEEKIITSKEELPEGIIISCADFPNHPDICTE